MREYIISITGASGSILGLRLIEELLKSDCKVHFLISKNGCNVMKYETGLTFDDAVQHFKKISEKINIYDVDDMFAPIASGSYKLDGMVIIPCSMGTLSSIACGISSNLIHRAADVCLKEKRKLIIVPRETPFNLIHLKNMAALSEMGANILPAVMTFYNKPTSIDDMINFIVGRVLDVLGIENNLFNRWI
ncbi:4-hydroxy-3-polyprenylbenzoate decarboxylase [Thermohydrogenium kirishiense]|nr:4-hydroxy-3-polyprenylbenzoate decarboxylase [Thermohydrogenium kirishiense]